MKRSVLMVGALVVLNLTAGRVFAQVQDTTKKTTTTTTTTVAAPADGATDVVGALASNADYSTALADVKAAGLDATLKTGGPYTIFAPNNAAFSALSPAKLDSLSKDPAKLATVLKGHVVTGKYAKADIIKALNAGKGKATLTTIDGQTLTLSVTADKKLQLANAAGNTAQVVLYDLVGANGVVNGLNAVLAPVK
ncbi:fasciclin domain-containing protein [Mucilaginibacter sp. RB4R14]|uniref:fasciclin domain-containing protein n=1 Tax=Mucilaginibacter aurantiaciroseus TaxID=2949308 RepID=UPI002090A690|nr:fasciclin domain-containing protein [Mucilaginibacter aurantiaciroseus]MCO5936418.1 fasciclin domain-containing protein [Mucilaginibacter aurantiaciroseus]